MPCCEAKNPAVGKTARVGIGGTTVSINAARKFLHRDAYPKNLQ
ncbi:MAG: hypothetical protein CM1200mP11_0170 [Nitrosopumilaceae archaeon]|nr:MAG: hypothetical protein CM1200mP11_0170 [Nitrosopumilaceae archaeon]